MLIKITKKCSMGCYHCMSNCMQTEEHMDFETFSNALSFSFDRAGNSPIIISGGEPMEHPNIESFLGYVMGYKSRKAHKTNLPVTVTTNGFWLNENIDFLKYLNKQFGDALVFQVTNDERYYPSKLDTTELSKFNNVLIETKLDGIYPMGRAIDNNLEWSRKSSFCFNVRALAKQIKNPTFKDIVEQQVLRVHFCTPNIDINGNIILGESDLCPVCSNIYKSDEEIINDIINFECHKCDFINNSLPDVYKQFVM